MKYLHPSWTPLPHHANDCPTYRHTCGGTITLHRAAPDQAATDALCDRCHAAWHRPNARFAWREDPR